MASSANINIFTDEGIDAAFDKVPIDKSLQTSLISKASLARLHDPSFPASSNRSVVRSSGNDYTVIGTIKLSWHKREADKSYLITFSVIESTSHLVILGRNALPEESGLDVRPLGLEPQAEGNSLFVHFR